MSGEATAEAELVSASLATTWRMGAAIGRACEAGDVVLLEGELGAGKTQVVRGMAEGMGIDPAVVSSPTFVLMREYEGEDQGGWRIAESGEGARPTLLVHIDAYRVGSAEELVDAGYDDELRAEAVTAIEWPSRAAGLVEAGGVRVVRVTIEHVGAGDDRRRVTIAGRVAIVEAARLACGDG